MGSASLNTGASDRDSALPEVEKMVTTACRSGGLGVLVEWLKK